MEISEVEINPIKSKSGLIAIASVVFDGDLFLGSIGVHQKLDGSGYRLTYPTRKSLDKSFNIYHPINKQASEAIERAIINKLKQVMQKENYEDKDYPN